MPQAASAGLLLYRRPGAGTELLLAHPGGPFWARRDLGAWSLPKGELDPGESPLEAARREFAEETGFAPAGPFLPLGEARQASGKRVHAWACEGDLDPALLRGNDFEMEWPPRSGRVQRFPEVDRVAWFTPDDAVLRLVAGQRVFVERLLQALAARPAG